MLQHIMVGIETWGTTPYSTIISVGACAFDPYAVEQTGIIRDRFEVAVDPVSCQGLLRVDPKAILWWMDSERDAVRAAWMGMPKLDLPVVLDSFADWLHSFVTISDLRIWGNGSDFDNVLLAQAYEVTKRDMPWHYWQNRCFRTLRNMITIPGIDDDPSSGTAHLALKGATHTALADAENQAWVTNRIVRKLGIKLT